MDNKFDDVLSESLSEVLGPELREYRANPQQFGDLDGDPIVHTIGCYVDDLDLTLDNIHKFDFTDFADNIMRIAGDRYLSPANTLTSTLYEELGLDDADTEKEETLLTKAKAIFQKIWEYVKNLVRSAPRIAIEVGKILLRTASILIAAAARLVRPLATLGGHLADFMTRTEGQFREIFGYEWADYKALKAKKKAGEPLSKEEHIKLEETEQEMSGGTTFGSKLFNPMLNGMTMFAGVWGTVIPGALKAASESILSLNRIVAKQGGIGETDTEDIVMPIIAGIISGVNTMFQSALGTIRAVFNIAITIISLAGFRPVGWFINKIRTITIEPLSQFADNWVDDLKSGLEQIAVEHNIDTTEAEQIQVEIINLRAELDNLTAVA